MTTRPSPDKGTWVLGLLGVLMVGHLGFLGWNSHHTDKAAEDFQNAAETYVTVILALMAPTPGKR